MADAKNRALTLYVQSRKAVTGFYRPAPGGIPAGEQQFGGPHGTPVGASEGDATSTGEAFFLSDDQARCAALVEELAQKRGYTVTVVDVAKVGRLERLVTEHLRGVQTFPVLMGPGDVRIEGVSAFSEEKLAELMPAELKGIRAFTYLKVHGGDLDRIREAVLNFPEVRELHLLTGDWDVFMVLEFAESANKRRVLDFVTEKIRGIPEVLDTSTLVPEFSVTKFPI